MYTYSLVFLNALTWWQITLAVIGSLFALYIIIFLITLCFVLSFKKRMKSKYKAICLQINLRYTLLKNIEDYFISKKVKLPNDFTSLMQDLKDLNEMNIDVSKRHDYIKTLSEAKAHLVFHIEQLDKYYDDNNYLSFKESYLKSEDEYRRLVSSYNLDVSGYNYWVKNIFYRYIFKLVRFKKLDTIR